MKLNKIGHLYDNIENDKFSISDTDGELILLNKERNYKIMYDTDQTLSLYEKSITKPVFGDVLIVGLGYGLVHYNFNLLNVNSITTIELESGIIDLVKPILPFVNYINADAYTFETDKMYDYIFLDIFSDKVHDYVIKQNGLIEKYKKYVRNDNIDYLKIHSIEL
jgi:spermidine synthase